MLSYNNSIRKSAATGGRILRPGKETTGLRYLYAGGGFGIIPIIAVTGRQA